MCAYALTFYYDSNIFYKRTLKLYFLSTGYSFEFTKNCFEFNFHKFATGKNLNIFQYVIIFSKVPYFSSKSQFL